MTERLNEVNKQMADVEAKLPDDIRPHYQRLLSARGEDALSAVEGRSCTACYTEITQQNYHNLTCDQFVLCKSCGRILYLPETAPAM